jgi:uncharacterized RDD family membrane protein YckC
MERDDLEYVGFWPRAGAQLIDVALIMCITWPFLIAFYGDTYMEEDPNLSIVGMIFGRGPFDFVMTWVLPGVLTVSFWAWKQATPGKMAIGAKIVDASSGRCPTVPQFIGRYFAGFLSLIPLGLGLFWVFFNPRRQAWHDLIAGTAVVRPKHRKQAVVTFGEPVSDRSALSGG